MGRRTSGRNIDGVLLLDKPYQLSSNAALQQVRRFFNANKAGHTGALDPLATGWLPLCFGEATKLSHYSLEARKSYQVTAQLGVTTTTSDAEGEVLEVRPVAVTTAQLEEVLGQFVGLQQQAPSLFSALKHQGKPLYHYARQGIEVPKKVREIEITALQLLQFEGDRFSLSVTCSKGTYIRTLIEDIGAALGCGAHVTALRRTWIEGVMAPLYTLEQVAAAAAQCDPARADYAALDALLAPADAVVQQLPELQVEWQEAIDLLHGRPIACHTDALGVPEGGPVRVRRRADQALLGVVQRQGQQWQPKRLFNGVPSIALGE